MATFVNDCPHCGASSAAFNIPYASENPVRGMYWNALAICPACEMASMFVHDGKAQISLDSLETLQAIATSTY